MPHKPSIRQRLVFKRLVEDLNKEIKASLERRNDSNRKFEVGIVVGLRKAKAIVNRNLVNLKGETYVD